MTYPNTRLRRNRKFSWLRDLVSDVSLSVNDLIMPLFVCEGKGIIEPIISMPGQNRYSIDMLIEQTKKIEAVGIKSIVLFPVVKAKLKSEFAEEAYNENNLLCRAVNSLKSSTNIGIICDVALDPYTLSGHDGVIIDGKIANDETIDILCKQAIIQIQAGCDIIAPSDMMDGRIGIIRKYMEERNLDVPIISYSAKYASNLYSPFRDAVNSRNNLGLSNKKTYQMDFRNKYESVREIEQDIIEGADIIMIKPAMLYLDIIKSIRDNFNIPIFAYQVSGEYAMIKSMDNSIDIMIESIISIKRAGANAILSYGSYEIAKII